MKKADFIICSLAVHAVLLIIAVLLPAPFASEAGYTPTDLAYVELNPPSEYQPEENAGQHTGPAGDSLGQINTGGGVPYYQSMFMPKAGGRLKLDGRLGALAAGRMARLGTAGQNGQAQPPARPDEPEPAPAPNSSATTAAAKVSDLQVPAEGHPPANMMRFGASGSVAASPGREMTGVVTGRKSINFRYQKGWPAPPMVGLDVDMPGGSWRVTPDEDWILVSGGTGSGRGRAEVGVMAAKLGLGYYEGRLKVQSGQSGRELAVVPVSVMVLPKDPGTPELPHFSWDGYMDGECKVCHMPEAVMPSRDYMKSPEFCKLCHVKDGMAGRKVPGPGGHPIMVKAGGGRTRKPTRGTVDSGPYSDRMAAHLQDGRVVCVTCHNVMNKPGDYGRTWELASSDDRKTYNLARGGWAGMGRLVPRVYVTKGVTPAPEKLSGTAGFIIDPDRYTYDELEGEITFDRPRPAMDTVYVTLVNPYLRQTTENNAQCYDCHTQNTHVSLNCLDCHTAHGTNNIKAVRGRIRMPGTKPRQVIFKSYTGLGSFADGTGALDGVCEVCHTNTKYYKSSGGHRVHKNGSDYSGRNCTKCHRHENGFGI